MSGGGDSCWDRVFTRPAKPSRPPPDERRLEEASAGRTLSLASAGLGVASILLVVLAYTPLFFTMGFVFLQVGVAAAVAAVTAGALATGKLSSGAAYRFLAIVGITLGAALLGAWILLSILFLVACISCANGNDTVCRCYADTCEQCPQERAACDGACWSSADSGSTEGALLAVAPLVLPASGLNVTTSRHPDRRNRLAHHPDTPAYVEDVYMLRGMRLCVGCFTTAPVFALAVAWMDWVHMPLPWNTALLLGLATAGVQAISSAGWARRRVVKVLVKVCLGIGLALATMGILHAPWPAWMQAGALAALIALAYASAIPRRRRMRA